MATVTMRLPDELLALVDAAAERDGVNRSAWVRAAVAKCVDGDSPVDDPVARVVRSARTSDPPPTKATKRVAALTGCAHRNKERLGYMTRCRDCGEKLR